MLTIEHDDKAGRFWTQVDGNEAVLDYRLAGRIMTITHTAVPAAIAGQGVAAHLMRAALKASKSAGWTVDPQCSYAAAFMRRHPDEGERRHQEDLLDEGLEESYPASDPPSVGKSS